MCTAVNVANYFLRCPEYQDPSDAISNMKLQKLLYFAQGHALAVLGKSLFAEEFEAWEHGPVLPSIYKKYKKYGAEKITPPTSLNLKNFTAEEKNLLDQVWQVYGGYSAWGLRNLSHNTPPWKNHKDDRSVIPQEEMKAYFITLNA